MLDLNITCHLTGIHSDQMMGTAIFMTGLSSASLSKDALLRQTNIKARMPLGVLASFPHRETDFLLCCQIGKCFPLRTLMRDYSFSQETRATQSKITYLCSRTIVHSFSICLLFPPA